MRHNRTLILLQFCFELLAPQIAFSLCSTCSASELPRSRNLCATCGCGERTTKQRRHDVIERMKAADLRFPRECVEGRLVAKNGHETLVRNALSSISSSDTYLPLYGHSLLPENSEYQRLFLRSICAVINTKFYWRNSGK